MFSRIASFKIAKIAGIVFATAFIFCTNVNAGFSCSWQGGDVVRWCITGGNILYVDYTPFRTDKHLVVAYDFVNKKVNIKGVKTTFAVNGRWLKIAGSSDNYNKVKDVVFNDLSKDVEVESDWREVLRESFEEQAEDNASQWAVESGLKSDVSKKLQFVIILHTLSLLMEKINKVVERDIFHNSADDNEEKSPSLFYPELFSFSGIGRIGDVAAVLRGRHGHIDEKKLLNDLNVLENFYFADNGRLPSLIRKFILLDSEFFDMAVEKIEEVDDNKKVKSQAAQVGDPKKIKNELVSRATEELSKSSPELGALMKELIRKGLIKYFKNRVAARIDLLPEWRMDRVIYFKVLNEKYGPPIMLGFLSNIDSLEHWRAVVDAFMSSYRAYEPDKEYSSLLDCIKNGKCDISKFTFHQARLLCLYKGFCPVSPIFNKRAYIVEQERARFLLYEMISIGVGSGDRDDKTKWLLEGWKYIPSRMKSLPAEAWSGINLNAVFYPMSILVENERLREDIIREINPYDPESLIWRLSVWSRASALHRLLLGCLKVR